MVRTLVPLKGPDDRTLLRLVKIHQITKEKEFEMKKFAMLFVILAIIIVSALAIAAPAFAAGSC